MIISEIKQIVINRDESNFDRACDLAYRLALGKFGVDDDGHITSVPQAEGSTCYVVVKFKEYRNVGGRFGQSCEYIFDTFVEKCEE